MFVLPHWTDFFKLLWWKFTEYFTPRPSRCSRCGLPFGLKRMDGSTVERKSYTCCKRCADEARQIMEEF